MAPGTWKMLRQDLSSFNLHKCTLSYRFRNVKIRKSWSSCATASLLAVSHFFNPIRKLNPRAERTVPRGRQTESGWGPHPMALAHGPPTPPSPAQTPSSPTFSCLVFLPSPISHSVSWSYLTSLYCHTFHVPHIVLSILHQ